MGIVRTCCNRELTASCLYGCDKHYCINSDAVEYRPVDISCSGYINREVLIKQLKDLEDNND